MLVLPLVRLAIFELTLFGLDCLGLKGAPQWFPEVLDTEVFFLLISVCLLYESAPPFEFLEVLSIMCGFSITRFIRVNLDLYPGV